MTAKETLELISKQWCTIEDLKKLSNLGNNNVYRLKKGNTGRIRSKWVYSTKRTNSNV